MLRRKTPKIETPALYLVGSERQEPVMRELHERFEQPMHRNFVRSRLYPAEIPVEPDDVPELRWLSDTMRDPKAVSYTHLTLPTILRV